MLFGVLNPEKNWHQQLVHLPTSPVYCSHFTLGNPKKVIFQQYYPFIHIIYVISEEIKLLPLYPPHLKNVTPLPCEMHNIFIWLKVCAFLRTLVDLKWAGCGLTLVALKRTGFGVRQMECQASNVTANVQSDHLLYGYMLPVFFATDQLYHPPCSAEIQPCRNKTLPFRNSSV